jgi:hypothetical protein
LKNHFATKTYSVAEERKEVTGRKMVNYILLKNSMGQTNIHGWRLNYIFTTQTTKIHDQAIIGNQTV